MPRRTLSACATLLLIAVAPRAAALRAAPRRRRPTVALCAAPQPPQTRPLVSLHSETIRVAGRPLIEDLTLTIAAGDRWALVGPNGAGKTTLATLLGSRVACGGFDQAPGAGAASSVGRAMLGRAELGLGVDELAARFGESGAPTAPTPEAAGAHLRYPSAKRYVGYEPRRRGSRLPVAADATPADEPALAGLEAAAAGAGAVLGRFGLDGLHHQPLFALSTGEARKLLVADYFLRTPRPPLLILDEAFDGLDEASRDALAAALADEAPTIVQVAHRLEDVEAVAPTKAVVLRGDGSRPSATGTRGAFDGEPSREVVRFDGVSVDYGGRRVFPGGLSFSLRAGEWVAVTGPNGCGKSTLVDLITGDNVLGFRQNLTLFGRRKGSGESVWDVKRQIGLLSPRSHEDYLAYADPSGGRGLGRSGAGVSSRDVVLSGFYDSVGLYDAPAPGHAAVADAWVDRLGIGDLVSDEPGSFGRLSLGQQKLALLARALVKSPRLLVLDEPTHALSRMSRGRFLSALAAVRDEPDVAVLYVTHRRDEIAALAVDRVLDLKTS
ncbi:ATPase [Aureococcus anophagefferens]|nr:ATPase [Aureococcus anophagefferens]